MSDDRKDPKDAKDETAQGSESTEATQQDNSKVPDDELDDAAGGRPPYQ